MSESSSLHQSVLLQESIAQLAIKPAGVYVDATLGRGGHTRAILDKLSETGQVIAFDKDPEAIAFAKQAINDKRLTLVHGSFTQMQSVLVAEDLTGKVDGILFDLGVSSPQLDQAERGFSFMREGKLDMRMDTQSGQTAAQWLSRVDEVTLANVIFEYGEERFSRRVAKAIVQAREVTPFTTTKQLADVIAAAIPKREPFKHPATRSFQAIRIFINQELDDLKIGLTYAATALGVGGRLVVISFHSLEDRLVKQFMKQQTEPPVLPRNIPIKQRDFQPEFRLIGKPIFPSQEEIKINVRARSAVLRTMEKQ